MPEKLEKYFFSILYLSRGMRLDVLLAGLFPDFSRVKIQQLVKQGNILVDGKQCRSSYKIRGNEEVTLLVASDPVVFWDPNPIHIEIIYEDENLIVVNKPAGMVTHPAPGNEDNTLLNALLFYNENLKYLPRCGLIHRLDKDTTGVLLVAKKITSYHFLVEHLQQRLVARTYHAIVENVPVSGSTIERPIGRDPKNRLKMAVNDRGKTAKTHFKVLKKFSKHALLEINLETGRTHQIRVHMSYEGYPIVGDSLYGARAIIPKNSSEKLIRVIRNFNRQALHAIKLGFQHPMQNKYMTFEKAPPSDMMELMFELEQRSSLDKKNLFLGK